MHCQSARIGTSAPIVKAGMSGYRLFARRALPQMEMRAKGERQKKGGDRGNQHKPAKYREDTLPKLSDLGITNLEASNRQMLAEAIEASPAVFCPPPPPNFPPHSLPF